MGDRWVSAIASTHPKFKTIKRPNLYIKIRAVRLVAMFCRKHPADYASPGGKLSHKAHGGYKVFNFATPCTSRLTLAALGRLSHPERIHAQQTAHLRYSNTGIGGIGSGNIKVHIRHFGGVPISESGATPLQ